MGSMGRAQHSQHIDTVIIITVIVLTRAGQDKAEHKKKASRTNLNGAFIARVWQAGGVGLVSFFSLAFWSPPSLFTIL